MREDVQFFEADGEKCWVLTTSQTMYILGLDNRGRLQHRYWGESLLHPLTFYTRSRFQATFPSGEKSLSIEEYPAWGEFLYTEPCLKVTFADGTRDVILSYSKHRVDIGADGRTTLVITLKDTYYAIEVDLHYTVVRQYDVIERWAVIRNRGETWLDIESALSGAWQLPLLQNGSYRLTHLSGRWAGEMQVQTTVVSDGRKTLESRRGLSSKEANPFFAIDLLSPNDNGATEESGQVWFGALAWSGNWKIVVEQTDNPTRAYVAGGINDFDFRWRLGPGEVFTTPPFVGGYTTGGFGQASRNLHRYQLEYILPRSHASEVRPVLYNSWEAVQFDVTEEKQLLLAERAAQLGIELFVVDDGWFGQRHHDRAGLGDWYVNADKFPRGLSPLIERVHELGMRFGIWVEPEMVNPDSDLYHQHPDWVYHFSHRLRSEERNQLLLNLARREVADHIYEWMDTFLSKNAIDFIKWDFNRSITEPGWPDAPEEHQREVYIRHIHAFYDIVEQLRTKHPSVIWEVCAGGGGRADLGSFTRFDQCWVSDNTDPFDRLFIQEGYSLAYAAKTMVAWVTDWPVSRLARHSDVLLQYRFHSAMTGTLGLGMNLLRLSEQQMTEAAALIAEYKAIRHIVQEGSLYRLLSPRDGNLTALQYVSHDRRESVLFVFLHAHDSWHTLPDIYPRGLNPLDAYQIEGIAGITLPVDGESLMRLGLRPQLKGHFSSTLIKLTSVVKPSSHRVQ